MHADRRRRAPGAAGPPPAARLPPGSTAPSWSNTRRIIADPLGLLLEHERRFGPVFTIRLLHEPIVWAIGAEVNHQILVSEFDAFQWREGRFADLWPLLGDGLLNIDGAYHRDFRMLMLPAFHREYIEGVAETMIEEARGRRRAACATAQVVEIYRWMRELALRIALRGLLGHGRGRGTRAGAGARRSRRRWRSTASRSCCRCCRGPGTPLARAIAARRALDAGWSAREIDERRRRGDPGPGRARAAAGATDETDAPLDGGAVRDQAVTLLFAGHDTTTTTFTFLLHELGRNPAARARGGGGARPGARHAIPAAADLDGHAAAGARALAEGDAAALPAGVGRAAAHARAT